MPDGSLHITAAQPPISLDEATTLVLAHALSRPAENVPLEAAGGRVLARSILARRDAPWADVAAMDGYAILDEDLSGRVAPLRVVGQSFAGRPFEGDLTPGTCVRVFTGAAVPGGATRVVMQEAARASGDRVFLAGDAADKRHIRRRGSDFHAGDALLEAGIVLTAGRMLAAAASDSASVQVVARPRVAVLATGDELTAPGLCAAPGATPDSISFGVAEIIRMRGAEVAALRRLPDHLPTLRSAAQAAVRDADVVVVIGGASVGERDHAREMFAPLGLETIFSKVALRPGKPVWFGRAGGALLVGLPGNPLAAMVTARLFLAPLLAGLSGLGAQSALNWSWRALEAPMESVGPWARLVPARCTPHGVEALDGQDASSQIALAKADMLILRESGAPPAGAGDIVKALPF